MSGSAISTEARARFDAALAQHRAGQLAAALAGYDAAIAAAPAYVDAHSNRGIVLAMLDQPEAAAESFGTAAAINPGYAEAHYNQALVLAGLGRWDAAVAAYDRTLAANPRHLTAAVNKGLALAKTNRHVEAVAAFDRVLAMLPANDPANVVVHCRRAYSLLELQQIDAALAGFNAALAVDPGHVESLFFKGETLIKQNRLEDALACLDAALAIEPDRADILDRGLTASQYLADWDRVAGFADRLDALGETRGMIGAFSQLSLVDDPALHRRLTQVHSDYIGKAVGARPRPPTNPPGERLRIGYFSADFHGHATMHLMAELLEAHDRDRFEISLFSFGASAPDTWNARARAAATRFLDLRFQSEAEIAAAARALQIDIAVDLKGDTGHARQGIFAERAAPLQIHYLGYPGTMGADWFDYIVVDPIVVPDSSRAHFTEKLLVLPDCYQPNCRDRTINRTPVTRAGFGLPAGFVFCCFNQGYKITAAVFEVWMTILADVPGSALWLWVEQPGAQDRLRLVAAARGIDPARLVFAQPLPAEDHLNRLALADLFLDTAPYGAHTTASDALRMGLPVVSCAGQSFASRVAASLLTTVGLADLATTDWPAYRALAVALALDPQRLAEVRARLAANLGTTPLFDPVRLVRNLEKGLVAIDARHRLGLPATDIRI